MDKILNLNNVDLYNQIYGLETLHPLVTVIDLNKATRQMTYTHWNYGVYALYLKLEKACDIYRQITAVYVTGFSLLIYVLDCSQYITGYCLQMPCGSCSRCQAQGGRRGQSGWRT